MRSCVGAFLQGGCGCHLLYAGAIAVLVAGGCVSPVPQRLSLRDELALRDRCVDVIRRAARYEESGIVRAAGIEAMQRHLGESALERVRASLRDESAGVRFAALVALGSIGSADGRSWVEPYAEAEEASIRLAACYALHRLGDTRRSGTFADALLQAESSDTRRDAAYLLGLLDEAGATKLLAKAMRDKDEDVRRQALESMAQLGNEEAIQQLIFWASSGPGYARVRAINVLSTLRRPSLADTLMYKLAKGEYLEVRLAAARGLAMLGRNDGMDLAVSALRFNAPRSDVGGDPPVDQVMRVRQLAARTLAATGQRSSLGALRRALEETADPRVQVAVADAVLDILGTDAVVSDRPVGRGDHAVEWNSR